MCKSVHPFSRLYRRDPHGASLLTSLPPGARTGVPRAPGGFSEALAAFAPGPRDPASQHLRAPRSPGPRRRSEGRCRAWLPGRPGETDGPSPALHRPGDARPRERGVARPRGSQVTPLRTGGEEVLAGSDPFRAEKLDSLTGVCVVYRGPRWPSARARAAGSPGVAGGTAVLSGFLPRRFFPGPVLWLHPPLPRRRVGASVASRVHRPGAVL